MMTTTIFPPGDHRRVYPVASDFSGIITRECLSCGATITFHKPENTEYFQVTCSYCAVCFPVNLTIPAQQIISKPELTTNVQASSKALISTETALNTSHPSHVTNVDLNMVEAIPIQDTFVALNSSDCFVADSENSISRQYCESISRVSVNILDGVISSVVFKSGPQPNITNSIFSAFRSQKDFHFDLSDHEQVVKW